MLHISPSTGLAKFLWSKPTQAGHVPMTISANDDSILEPVQENLDDWSFNRNGQLSQTTEIVTSGQADSSAPKMANLREFWTYHMNATEEKWKQYHNNDIDTEIGEVDWGAITEKFAWRRHLYQEQPDNISNDEWQKLQEMSNQQRPWFKYKSCGLYARLLYDPESRPIFQEFDFV